MRLDAMGAIVARDARLFLSHPGRLVSQVAVAFLGLALFYYVSRLVGSTRFASPDAYFAFVVIGLAILQILTAALATLPLTVRNELLGGTFERLVVSPLGASAGIVAMAVFPSALALGISVVTILLAALVFGLSLEPTAPLALPIAVLGWLAFLPFALVLAGLVLVAKQAGGASRFIVVALALAGGVYFPATLLPDWVGWLAAVQPFTPTLDLLRAVLVDQPLADPAWLELLRLAGFAVVCIPIAWLALEGAIEVCRRRGTLIEA